MKSTQILPRTLRIDPRYSVSHEEAQRLLRARTHCRGNIPVIESLDTKDLLKMPTFGVKIHQLLDIALTRDIDVDVELTGAMLTQFYREQTSCTWMCVETEVRDLKNVPILDEPSFRTRSIKVADLLQARILLAMLGVHKATMPCWTPFNATASETKTPFSVYVVHEVEGNRHHIVVTDRLPEKSTPYGATLCILPPAETAQS